MRKLSLAIPLLATLALAGCSTSQVNSTIVAVQEATAKYCAYVPTIQTVSKIIEALGLTGASSVADIAAQICSAVTAKSARRGASVPTVAGVRVQGKFLR